MKIVLRYRKRFKNAYTCCIDVELCYFLKSMFYIKKFQKPINDAFRDVRLYTLALQFDSALFDVYSRDGNE